MHKTLSLGVSLFAMLLLLSSQVFAAPQSELWPTWDNSNESNSATFDHSQWQHLLDRYLTEQGQHTLFNYGAVSSQDKAVLEQYLTDLTSLDPRNYRQSEQFAYWVNLYNALTVKVILDEYPIKSITKLGGFLSFGPWDDKATTVAGQSLTLNDIEHRILRPIWNDSRIHYAVNCASLGCPNLAKTAFTAENTESLLDAAATQFTNSAKGASVDGNTLTLSSIYEWYGVDFGDNEQAILKQIDVYRDGKPLKDWSGKIQYDYDWSLNKP
ncbi:DUF547 domain-containing protein [Enterovibrio calviensis]|uniref:DUF547 domain-containing protein n=1 Tax=Enterovibrio calviensis TaxID=91359 RepID=UPI003734DEA7